MSFANNAATTLASGINTSVTSLTVASGTGTLFPTLTGSQYFYCTLESVAGTSREIVKVTARSTDTFTIARGQDGTTGTAFSTGDKVELRLVRANLTDFALLDEVNTFSQQQTFSGTTIIPTATITTLNTPSGVLATQNGMSGIAKAWVQYAGGTTTIYGSFNVSSVTVLGTGSSRINFTTAMPNTNYAVHSSVAGDGQVSVTYLNGGKSTAITTGYVEIATAYFIGPSSWSGSNPTAVSVSIFSS